MAEPQPVLEDFEDKSDTETDEEEEEEEEENEGSNEGKEPDKSNSDKLGDSWLTTFIRRTIPLEADTAFQREINKIRQNKFDRIQKELEVRTNLSEDFHPFREKENKNIPHYSEEFNHNRRENNLKETDTVREEDEHFEEFSKQRTAFGEREDANKYIPQYKEEFNDYGRGNNLKETDTVREEDGHFEEFSKERSTFVEREDENNVDYTNENAEYFTDHSEDISDFENEENKNEDDLEVEEGKPVFEHSKESVLIEEEINDSNRKIEDSEILEYLDGKEGEPDPYAYAPLDCTDGIKVGDERWNAMMEQIMYTSPYEDYVPLEHKPPHEAIWEKWDRMDYNEGRWVDETEFADDPDLPTNIDLDFEEIRRLAKLLQEGKPLPYE